VDDDSSVLLSVKRQLASLGWEAHTAPTANAALSMLGSLESVEALLTDINMPAMDGISLGREVVNRFPGIAVVLMSGGHDALPRAPELSRSILLRKPFTAQALAAALDAACGGRD
jgi:DNA-binding NtrC family response regulator